MRCFVFQVQWSVSALIFFVCLAESQPDKSGTKGRGVAWEQSPLLTVSEQTGYMPSILPSSSGDSHTLFKLAAAFQSG